MTAREAQKQHEAEQALKQPIFDARAASRALAQQSMEELQFEWQI